MTRLLLSVDVRFSAVISDHLHCAVLNDFIRLNDAVALMYLNSEMSSSADEF